MDLKQIKSLLNLISESDVNEVYIEEGDFKIKIKSNLTPLTKLRLFSILPHRPLRLLKSRPPDRHHRPPVPTQEGGNQQPTAISGEIIQVTHSRNILLIPLPRRTSHLSV